MSSLLSRILLSLIMFPLAFVVFVASYHILGPALQDAYAFLWSAVFTAFFVAVYWLGLWRASVRWTVWRSLATLLAGWVAVLAAIVFSAVLIALSGDGWIQMPAFLLAGILGITLWLAATCIIWRETAGERAERIRRGARDRMFCPRCGYNMTGLRESRCPECGTVFTLDELFAAQHAEPIADASEPARPSSC